MDAKRYLKQIGKLEEMIRQREEEIEQIRQEAASIRAVSYDKPVVQSSSGNDGAINLISYLVELGKELDSIKLDYYQTKDRIITEIQMMEKPEYMTLLHKRYIERKSFELISVEMNYAYQSVINMHKSALDDFEKMISEYKKVC